MRACGEERAGTAAVGMELVADDGDGKRSAALEQHTLQITTVVVPALSLAAWLC